MKAGTWVERLRAVARRNRPSRKPQLWEDLPLALRRRLAFELGRRTQDDWMHRLRVVELSQVGFRDERPPLRMEIVAREMMNQALYLYGSFEISETRLVQSFLEPGMTFVDVGANIGYYTLIAARMVGTTGSIHAFEPNHAIRPRLKQNIERNGFGNVVVHDEAVARQSGTVSFYPSAIEANEGISSMIPGNDRAAAEVVPSVTLDDFVSGLGGKRVDLIKVDVEGAELQVVEGGLRTLSADDAPPIIFEAFDLAPMASALGPLRYHIRRLHYTLERGLDLPLPDASFDNLFEDYEAPNYFAAKDEAVFRDVVERANAGRSPALRLLGRA